VSADVHPQPAWAWPLDLAAYDRSGELNDAEMSALDEVLRGKCWQAIRLEKSSELSRLSRPVADALALTGADPPIRRGVMKLMVRETKRRGKAFWAWSREEWIEILSDTYTFHRRHGVFTICRQYVLAVGYLLKCFNDVSALGSFNRQRLANKVFGKGRVNASVDAVTRTLMSWGYHNANTTVEFRSALCEVMLANQSPRLQDLTAEALKAARHPNSPRRLREGIFSLSRVLAGMGIIPKPLNQFCLKQPGTGDATLGVPAEWVQIVQRWRATTTCAPKTRTLYYGLTLKVGRWVSQTHPEATSPQNWTRDIAAQWVATVCRLNVGDWVETRKRHPNWGRPLSPRCKLHHLGALSTFFRDCQEWEWIPRRFDPGRSFAAPRSLLALISPNPRVIADDIWAKLLWAGLNLAESDFSQAGSGPSCYHCYPLAMIRALTMVWLFAGMRRDEIRRLSVSCVRQQMIQGDGSEGYVCLLVVPASKTGPEFTKPVDGVVGEAISAWEQIRPEQPAQVDEKTGLMTRYLFSFRGRRISADYFNRALIPTLCRKAGVPLVDALGSITSHRARSTIASQLYNAKDPMSLFELQQWLGHRTLTSTQQYAKINPIKLAKAYENADYFRRNLRTIEVLIDRDVVINGTAAKEPWKFYDLGHGYCTYDFFDQCPHRMACARCAFYRPKGSAEAQLLEGKGNLLRMRQEIPLTDAERAAVDDGLAAMEKLLAHLADVPTPAGPTPCELKTSGLVRLKIRAASPSTERRANQMVAG